MSEPPTDGAHPPELSTDATPGLLVSDTETDVVFSIAAPSQTGGEYLDLPASPVATGTALTDPTAPLRQALERTKSERDKLVAERDRFSKASDEYKAADAKVKEAETRVAEATSALEVESKRLKQYLEVHRSFEAGAEARSVTQLQAAHDAALKLFSQTKQDEDWETAILAIKLVIETVGEMGRIEKEDAAALAAARADQLERANALKKEANDAEIASKRAKKELADLKAKMAEAAQRISTIQNKEEKEISEAERAYATAVDTATKKRIQMAPKVAESTPKRPTKPVMAPTPVTPPPELLLDKQPAPQAPPPPQPSRSSFVTPRQTEPPPKATPLPSLSRPWIPTEVDRAWDMLLDSANFPRSNRPRDLRISRADFVRAVGANPELKRVFGNPRTTRRTLARIDRDANDEITKDELSDYLRFPSARRNATVSTGDAADVFDSIADGVERVREIY